MEAKPTKAEPPKRKRRWFQFSLRTLLIFATIVAVSCAWIERRAERKSKERDTARAVVKSGGTVYYDYEWIDNHWVHGEPSGPEWMRAFFGETFLNEVVYVQPGKEITDEGLANLAESFPHLRSLYIGNSRITDAGLMKLQRMQEIKRLSLSATAVTDAGMESLKDLTQLETLAVAITKVTDVGLRRLQGLTNLKHLILGYTKITDAGLESLQAMDRLEELDLSGTAITDNGLARLERNKQLRLLWVRDTSVTDEGIKRFRESVPHCEIR